MLKKVIKGTQVAVASSVLAVFGFTGLASATVSHGAHNTSSDWNSSSDNGWRQSRTSENSSYVNLQVSQHTSTGYSSNWNSDSWDQRDYYGQDRDQWRGNTTNWGSHYRESGDNWSDNSYDNDNDWSGVATETVDHNDYDYQSTSWGDEDTDYDYNYTNEVSDHANNHGDDSEDPENGYVEEDWGNSNNEEHDGNMVAHEDYSAVDEHEAYEAEADDADVTADYDDYSDQSDYNEVASYDADDSDCSRYQ